MRIRSILATCSVALAIKPAPSQSAMNSRFRSWPITEAAALEPALRAMGLRVPAHEIDGTGGTGAPAKGDALSDALCSVGPAGRGGTGSFISSTGLIITNHHVALDAVRQASTEQKDYLRDGFVASCREDEIAGPDYVSSKLSFLKRVIECVCVFYGFWGGVQTRTLVWRRVGPSLPTAFVQPTIVCACFPASRRSIQEVWVTRSCVDVSAQFEASRQESDPLKRANLVRDLRQAIAREAEAASEVLRA